VPKATNFLNKACEKKYVRSTIVCKGDKSGEIAHIMGGSRGFVGFQRNFGFFSLLQALRVSGHRNLLYRGPGNPRRNFLGRGLIVNSRRN
jgi:hypothetical protein